jgi:predicted DsbA family dithiol-disulfide isomerase
LRSSTSRLAQSAGLRRAFHASTACRRDHHFDTLKFVQRLQEDGFTEDQSVAMMKVLNDVIEERYRSIPFNLDQIPTYTKGPP